MRTPKMLSWTKITNWNAGSIEYQHERGCIVWQMDHVFKFEKTSPKMGRLSIFWPDGTLLIEQNIEHDQPDFEDHIARLIARTVDTYMPDTLKRKRCIA